MKTAGRKIRSEELHAVETSISDILMNFISTSSAAAAAASLMHCMAWVAAASASETNSTDSRRRLW